LLDLAAIIDGSGDERRETGERFDKLVGAPDGQDIGPVADKA
jgi:hypothetical protein